MIWRLVNTITTIGDTDFVYNLQEIGLISLLELWIGVIIACLPTLGPLLKTYVKPAVAKIGSKLSNPSTDRGTINLKDLSSAQSSRHGTRRNYDKLGDNVSLADLERAKVAAGEQHAVTTKCQYSPSAEAPRDSRPVIYVQRDITTSQDSWERGR